MGIVLRVKASDKVTLSERTLRFLQSIAQFRDAPISKEQWEKLSPYMQEKFKNRQIMWVTSKNPM